MAITFENIRVWDTSERIDLMVPGVDTDRGMLDFAALSGSSKDAGHVIDASALTVAPGLADPHVHFRDPGQTDKETMDTGARAAAAGGYTRVLIMPNTIPAADGVLPYGDGTVLDYLETYETTHHPLPVRYDLCVCASMRREGLKPTRLADWSRFLTPPPRDPSPVADAPRHPIRAISDDGTAVSDAVLDATMNNAVAAGIPISDHCERHKSGVMTDGAVSHRLGLPGIPPETETTIIERDIAAARRTGAHIHLQHVSTARSFDLIRKAKADGVPITCETAPHYLALCDEDVESYGPLAKMNPPLRSAADRQAAVTAVADGTVDMIATDHAPHTTAQKDLGMVDAPNGVIGLETAYGVCHRILVDSGYIDDRRLIELMSLAPNRLMGHVSTDVAALLNTSSACSERRTLDLSLVEHPEDADLVILDTSRSWTICAADFQSQARNTPFDGWIVTGRAVGTVIGSRLVSLTTGLLGG
ncbi:dihydroorotase [uncultured Bifidobacterium sp.]|uniref:dihydroorotase n=1 Tax=uncultured Bifidobacterium sp. TaxID=165187 RepID=UPI00260941DF|nr:dihydroorotase [uncultured Bifidobacterium sp.]